MSYHLGQILQAQPRHYHLAVTQDNGSDAWILRGPGCETVRPSP
jgi:hypothetical protein